MLVPNQYVEVKWNGNNKDWFIKKGYEFTKFKDVFLVRAEDLMLSSRIFVKAQCDRCGKIYDVQYRYYIKNISNNTDGKYLCRTCKNFYLKREEHMKLFYEFCENNNFEPISTINDYTYAKGKLYYECPRHGMQYTTPTNIKSGIAGCLGCGLEKALEKTRYSQDEVKKIINSKNDNIWLNYGEYKNNSTVNLQIPCKMCGNVFTTSLAVYKKSSGYCSTCAHKDAYEAKKLTLKEVEDRINSKNNNKLLNPQDYISYGVNNLKIQCGECGETYVTSLADYENKDRVRCKKCSFKISSLERIVMDFLDAHNISYIYNKKFEDCKDISYLPFDFYLPEYNLVIETDGKQHFEPIWGEENFKYILLHDAMKNNYCRWNNIDLLRIPYWDGANIENIISDYLGIDYYRKIDYVPSKIRKQNIDEKEIA